MSDNDDNKLIAERRAKLGAIREHGNAYPNDFRPDALAGELQAEYADSGLHTAEAIEQLGRRVAVAGRMLAKRGQGKVSFVNLQDRSGRIQLFVHQGTLDPAVYDAAKGWDIGDIVGATGVLMRTKTGELSIKVDGLRLLTKSLRPLPDKWHGLADVETRYRQRYVDLIINEDSRQVFRQRAEIVRFLRNFLETPPYGFMEVETPMMHVIPGGATARPFKTHHNALDLDMYLRVAPELYLKRLTVGGFERVYEINRNFRNEGVSTRHNPEFTMLELYQAYASYSEIMDITEAMIREAAKAVIGTTALTWEGAAIDVGPAFRRWRMDEAVRHYNPEIGADDCRDRAKLAAHAERLGIHVKKDYGWGKLLLEIFEKTVEGKLIQPTFITQHPVEVSPLARQRHRSRPHRPLRAVHQRQGTGERLLGVERPGRPGGALPRPGRGQGLRRRRGHALRRRLHPRAGSRPAADRWARRRHRPAGDVPHRSGLDPRRAPVPLHATGSVGRALRAAAVRTDVGRAPPATAKHPVAGRALPAIAKHPVAGRAPPAIAKHPVAGRALPAIAKHPAVGRALPAIATRCGNCVQRSASSQGRHRPPSRSTPS